jgi:hypothetical protein
MRKQADPLKYGSVAVVLMMGPSNFLVKFIPSVDVAKPKAL